jgi:hypothetical protein
MIDITELSKSIIGINKDVAIKHIEDNDFTYRIASENGVGRMLTANYVMGRINLDIVDDIVTETFIG